MRLATLSGLKLPNHSVRLMASLLREHGRDVGVALNAAGLTQAQLADASGEVTGSQELAFQRAFYELTIDQPLLWIDMGARYRLLSHAHGSYGLMMVTAATMQDAIETGLRFGDLYYTLSTGIGIYDGDRLTGFRSLTTEVPPDLRRFSMLRDLGTNCTVFADLWGGPFPFERVELPLSAEDDVHVRHYLPDVQITYEASCAAWYWSIRLDDRKPQQSDATLHEFYSEQCENAVRLARDAGDIVQRIVDLLGQAEGHLDLRDAARRAGMSVRSLQRKLEERGVSYRELTAMGRYRAACRMLTETRAPITRIALEVGYDNVSSFNHAFKRFAGMSPRSYRHGASSAAG